MNKTTKALKLAEEALEELHYSSGTVKAVTLYKRAIAVIHEALADHIADAGKMVAEPTKQEPVAIGNEWKPCMKLPIVVHVREQRKGETHVSTREGITPILPTDLIMRGVAGEEYPIGYELFNKTYTFETAAPVQPVKQEPVHEALQIASVALQDIACSSQTENLYWWQLRARKAQKQIAERLTIHAPVQPVKQEPVAWTNYNGAVNNRLKGAPVDAKAIRAEALEEAARVCDWYIKQANINYSEECAVAIRGLK